VARYLLRIAEATRGHRDLELGVSPRGALAFFRAAQARAMIAGRRYASPDDVQALAGPVLGHRLLLTTQAKYGGVTAGAVLAGIVQAIEVPT
jgi:MoxR-like ATPase